MPASKMALPFSTTDIIFHDRRRFAETVRVFPVSIPTCSQSSGLPVQLGRLVVTSLGRCERVEWREMERRAIDVLLYEPVTDLNTVTVSRLVRGGISYYETYNCEDRSVVRRVALCTLLSAPMRCDA